MAEANDIKTPEVATEEWTPDYSQIRNDFLQYARSNKFEKSNVSWQNGGKDLFRHAGASGFNSIMTGRVGGFETLFDTLAQGIVEDPDYAMKKDWRIYDRIMRDPQVFYCMQVRTAATAGLPWSIVPPTNYEKDVKALEIAARTEQRIRAIPRFSTLLGNMLSALLSGISISELVWEVDDNGQYVVNKHFPMNKDRFKFGLHGTLRLLSPSSPTTGTPVPNYKFIQHTYGIADGSWKEPGKSGYVYYGKGLVDTPLYHYFFFKITALKFLLQALERYGNPTKFIYSGAQNSKLGKQMAEVMLSLKNDSVVLIPGKPDEIKVEVPKIPVSAPLFQYFIEYIDRLITRAILGQDLMTENITSSGSRAAAQVHKSVFGWLAEEDKNALQHTLNDTLLKFDAELNMQDVPKEIRPVLKFKQAAAEDAAAFLTTVASAQNLGMDISMQQLRERTGLKEPKDAADTLIRQQPEIDPSMSGEEALPQKVESNPNGKTQRKPMAQKGRVRPANKKNINFKTAARARKVNTARPTKRSKVS